MKRAAQARTAFWLRAMRWTLGALAAFVPSVAAAREDGPSEGRVDDSVRSNSDGGGVYGRFDGDLSLSVGLGADADFEYGSVRPSAHLGARFYQTLGLRTSLGQAVDSGDPVERMLGVAVLVEPLFLLRWNADKEWGKAFWDLTLDSLSLSVGTHITEPRGGNFGDVAGAEFGLGLGLPLALRAEGPWLRARFSGLTGRGDFEPLLTVYLDWQWLFAVGLLDD